ncbi:MAG: hypothetical protein OXK20_01160 [Deltaproteobacteria bacterium]|nr:hypothetical protein [Deltaproteobacteria bacterium]
MATRRRPRKRRQKNHRAWLLIPAIILAVMVGWLYRDEILNLVTFRFQGIDFTTPPRETRSPDRGGITGKDRKELEKILENH